MSGENGELSDLFGEQLVSADTPAKPAPFKDGVYTIKGVSMKKGIYKTGKWKDKPYARFVYELQDGPVTRQVSQMLPWFPGKAFFEINFQRLCGMKLSEFSEHCRRENLNDAKAQSRFFLTLFRDVEYKAEIRQRGDWINVWELKQRMGHAGDNDTLPSAPAATEPPLAAPAAPVTSIDPSAVLVELSAKLSLSESDLAALSQEEFGVPVNVLEPAQQQVLIDLLKERLQSRQSESPF
jgi:hypothetical protein